MAAKRELIALKDRRKKANPVAKKGRRDDRWATSDKAAYELLERIAAKAVEPMSDDDPDSPLGQGGAELVELLCEAVNFVMNRNAGRESHDNLME